MLDRSDDTVDDQLADPGSSRRQQRAADRQKAQTQGRNVIRLPNEPQGLRRVNQRISQFLPLLQQPTHEILPPKWNSLALLDRELCEAKITLSAKMTIARQAQICRANPMLAYDEV